MIEIILLAVCALLVPWSAWLTVRLIGVERDFATLAATAAEKFSQISANCDRHQAWDDSLQKSISRMDKNIARLCQKAGIEESD